MLAKCMNASCFTSFRHLAKGRLFRLETESPVGSSNAKATEYFWLCESCSAGMTLHLAQDGTVMPTRLQEGFRNGTQLALTSLNRENGRFLRTVGFLPRSHPMGT